MKHILGCCLGVVSLVVVTVVSGWAQSAPFCGPTACQPHPLPSPVERTVNVSVPVPRPLPPACPVSPAPGYSCHPPVNCRPAPPVCGYPQRKPSHPTSVPVRLNVSVTPRFADHRRMVPVVYSSPGPIEPVVSNAVGLAGALVALPFGVADMFLPTYHPGLSLRGRREGRPRPCNVAPTRPCFTTPICGPPAPACPPPVCRIPMKCAPVGPSVAPIPGPAGPQPCRPYLPPRIVEDPEFPCLEPRGLISGLVSFPSRVLQRARLLGDMNRDRSSCPSRR